MEQKELGFEPGTLWKKTRYRTDNALKTGALVPITTEGMFIYDSGVDFQVRIVSNLARKVEEKKVQEEHRNTHKKKPNPFLPYEDDMFVADISDTHVCLLNKFNVIDHHLLLVTRVYENQELLLTLKDFEAILICMSEFEGLAFYNGGKEAGASQKHKHLQMIPLPMAETGPRIPLEPLFANARFDGRLGLVPGLSFLHSFVIFDPNVLEDISKAAETVFRLYRDMLWKVGLNRSEEPEENRQSGPYNLLLTREWMLLVPRAKEFFGSSSINALGFAGALLVRNEEQVRMLKEHGCMAMLKHTAV